MQSQRREIATSAAASRAARFVTAQVESALRVLRVVAERPDPTAAIGSGEIARELGQGASRVSRTCTELERVGLLQAGQRYGSYRLGRAAIRLSGRAAAPVARSVRYALILAAQYTGETACVAARTGDSWHISASVGSEWTLHAPADVGERVVDGSAISDAGDEGIRSSSGHARVFESRAELVLEVATPVFRSDGECVAVVAIRLPTNRATGGVPRARRAVEAARRRIEAIIGVEHIVAERPDGSPQPAATTSEPALDATVRILEHLAVGPASAAGIARSTGLRPDRVQRLLESAARAGIVGERTDGGGVELGWAIHGWHRAATGPTLTSIGRDVVAQTAAEVGVFGFITILRGIRSFTVVEELGESHGGLVMMSWLGRPHPVIGSDGGPTLVMEFEPGDLVGLLGKRHTERELETLVAHIGTVSRRGVISIDSDRDSGFISTSAPIRDASGAVAGAACLTGGTDAVLPRRAEVERATLELAARLTELLS